MTNLIVASYKDEVQAIAAAQKRHDTDGSRRILLINASLPLTAITIATV